MPLRPLGLQLVIRPRNRPARRAADRKLHGHDRQAEADQEDQIQQNERRAAVLARDVRKPPHVAQADRTARRNQDKAQAGAEGLALFHGNVLSFSNAPLTR